MIAFLQRAHHTHYVLTTQLVPDETGKDVVRVIDGDLHSNPIQPVIARDALPQLAEVLDAPVTRLGRRAPARPVWFCAIRSDPNLPDLHDSQWAQVARRIVAATGIAPVGDPAACRWIALRSQERQVHIVATLAREDGHVHQPYRDAFRLQQECDRIAADLGHTPHPPAPTPLLPEPSMPLTVTITAEPSGAVVARGGDTLAHTLLTHAGFRHTNDWHGPRHRLPTTMPRAEQTAIAAHATAMLTAARYTVDLDPTLTPPTIPPHLQHLLLLGESVLEITDRIRGSASGTGLAQVLDPLLHPDHGLVERVREALEAAGEQITDLDDDAYQLADRFGFASEFLTAAQGELEGAQDELRQLAPAPQHDMEPERDVADAARATSPTAQTRSAPSTPRSTPATTTPAAATPVRDAASRTR